MFINKLTAPLNRFFESITIEQTKVNRLIYFLVLLGVLIASLASVNDWYDFADFPKKLTVLIVAIVICIVLVLQSQFRVTKLHLVITLFLIYSLLRSVTTTNIYESLTVWMHWFVCGVIFLAISQLGRAFVKKILIGLSLVCIPIGIISILQYFQLDQGLLIQLSQPASTFGQSQLAAQVYAIILPIVVGLTLLSQSTKTLVLQSLLIVFYGYVLLISQSLFAIIAAMTASIAVVVVLICTHKSQHLATILKPLGASVTALLLAVLLFALTKPSTADSNYIHQLKSVSIDQHIPAWANSRAIISDAPIFGIGLNQTQIVYPLYSNAVVLDDNFNEQLQLDRIENDYLQMIVELGVIGLLLLLAIVYYTIRAVLKTQNETLHLNSIAFSGVTVISLIALVSNPLYSAFLPILLAILVGLIATSEANKQLNIRHFSTKTVAAANLIIGCYLLFFWYLPQAKAETSYAKAMFSYAENKFSDAEKFANKAYQLNLNNKKVLSLLGFAESYGRLQRSAIRNIKQYLLYYPNDVETMLVLGRIESSLDRQKEAIKTFETAIALVPHYAAPYIELGGIYQQYGGTMLAKQNYLQALEYEPNNINLLINLAVLYFSSKGQEPSDAIPLLEKILKLEPNHPAADRISEILLDLRASSAEDKSEVIEE